VTLLETMAALALIGVFATVTSHFFHSWATITQQTSAASATALSLDSAIAQLRRDVWGAQEIKPAAHRGVMIRPASGTWITWDVDADGALVRAGAVEGREETYRWPDLGPGLSLRSHGEGAILTVEEPKSGRKQVLRLVSQVQLLRRARP
jgi:type II secretory pathway pseudopilin PulG